MPERRLPVIVSLMIVSTAFLWLSLRTRDVRALQGWTLTCVVGTALLRTPRYRREPSVEEQLQPLHQAVSISPETQAQLDSLLANIRC